MYFDAHWLSPSIFDTFCAINGDFGSFVGSMNGSFIGTMNGSIFGLLSFGKYPSILFVNGTLDGFECGLNDGFCVGFDLFAVGVGGFDGLIIGSFGDIFAVNFGAMNGVSVGAMDGFFWFGFAVINGVGLGLIVGLEHKPIGSKPKKFGISSISNDLLNGSIAAS